MTEGDTAIDTIGKTAYTLGADKTSETGVTDFGNSMTSSAFANRYYDAVMGNTEDTTGLATDYTVTTITSKTTKLFDAEAVSAGKDYKVYAVCLMFVNVN